MVNGGFDSSGKLHGCACVLKIIFCSLEGENIIFVAVTLQSEMQVVVRALTYVLLPLFFVSGQIIALCIVLGSEFSMPVLLKFQFF